MEGLTFGEQVKIILKRKGMTIKELAEMIEARTGKAMSRQNLTQRLGRDNFQEQDMRMIAAILDCPFHLSIFPDEAEQTATVYPFEVPALGRTEDSEKNQPKERKENRIEPEQAAAGQAEERDITIGELYAIHEELDELEKSLRSNETEMNLMPEYGAEADKPVFDEVKEGSPVAGEESDEGFAGVEEVQEVPEQSKVEETSLTEEPPVAEEASAAEKAAYEADVLLEAEEDAENSSEEEPVEGAEAIAEKEPSAREEVRPKKERFLTGRIFMRRKSNTAAEEKRETEEKVIVEEKTEEKKEPGLSRKITKEIVLPNKEQFLAADAPAEEKEDLTIGEVNPYTRHEYESNSVRMHPSRIGYVQVYDRSQHKWTDMTEWAFLGYQERKKALLGDKYEPPIYLD